jgi:hypothetical protein
MHNKIKSWCDPEGLSIEFVERVTQHAVSNIDPAVNHWWATLQRSLEECQLRVVPEVFPAGTDSR